MIVVDPDGSVTQCSRDAFRLPRIRRPHGARQAVDRVVAQRDGFLLGGEGLDREHGPEGLVLHAGHVGPAAIEHSGKVVAAARERGEFDGIGGAPAAPEHGSLPESPRHVLLDLLPVLGGDERAGLGIGVEGTAEADALGAAHDLVDDAVVDRFLHQQPCPRRADLAAVEEDRRERVVDGSIEVGIGEDDVGILAPEFERDLLHRRGGVGHDASPGHYPAREGHHVHVGMRGERGTRRRARTQDQVAYTGW